MKDILQHKIHPLHLYCRLRKVFSKQTSISLCTAYEKKLYRLLFPLKKHMT